MNRENPVEAPAGELLHDEPLSRHTTWRVGGPARTFYRPRGREDLVRFLRRLPADEPLLWLGMGSNLLVRDGGFEGTVLSTQGCLDELSMEQPTLLCAEAGVACPRAARFAVHLGLCGIEFLAGIPGTVGGALAMNAGAFGGETWQRVASVETVDRLGRVRQRGTEDFSVGYRRVRGPEGEWFLAARLQLESGDAEAALVRIRQLLERRAASQPLGRPSCGSVFRNPEGAYAAQLIEQAGLKGFAVGGAVVSEKHANFILNTGEAKAADIEALIEEVQRRVEAASGIRLQTEVQVVGERV